MTDNPPRHDTTLTAESLDELERLARAEDYNCFDSLGYDTILALVAAARERDELRGQRDGARDARDFAVATGELAQERIDGVTKLCDELRERNRLLAESAEAAEKDRDHWRLRHTAAADELADARAINEQMLAKVDDAHEALRSLASRVGNGGYNAPEVDPVAFEAKVSDGIDSLMRVERELGRKEGAESERLAVVAEASRGLATLKGADYLNNRSGIEWLRGRVERGEHVKGSG